MRRRPKGLTTRVTTAAAAAAAEPPEPTISDTGDVPALTDPSLDAALRDAVDLARAVAVEAAGEAVGDYLGAESEDDLVVTHAFATKDKAYVGWRWSVTVTR